MIPVTYFTSRFHPFSIATRLEVGGVADMDVSFELAQRVF
jgi:hypothetical protein